MSETDQIEVGANTLKSSSTFQLHTKIMFSFKKTFFKKKMLDFFWEKKAHISITEYLQIEGKKQ